MKFIYKITCLKNNKVYIGQTANIKNRKYTHFTKLRGGYHSNKNLQHDFNLYNDISQFKFDVIECVEDNLAYEGEDYYINIFRRYKQFKCL